VDSRDYAQIYYLFIAQCQRGRAVDNVICCLILDTLYRTANRLQLSAKSRLAGDFLWRRIAAGEAKVYRPHTVRWIGLLGLGLPVGAVMTRD